MKVEDDTAVEPRPDKEETQNSPTDVTLMPNEEQDMREVEERPVELRLAGGGASSESSLRSAFIRQYFSEVVDVCGRRPPPSSHPPVTQNIVHACSKGPYSLYLYVGVPLDRGQHTSVLLVGYVDLSSGLSVVKLLDTLQLRTNSGDSGADLEPGAISAAAADARLLINRLKKCGLPLGQLRVFYCNAHPVVSRMFELRLQTFSPRSISLCGLPGIAGRAVQAGLLRAFPWVLHAIREIHHHYSTCPEVDHTLKEVFAMPYRPFQPVCTQPLSVINVVEKLSSSWKDIKESFFDVRHIKGLMDDKLELCFRFLSSALQPLRALQVMQDAAAADVAQELQLILILLQSYAASLLQPSASTCFLKKWDISILQTKENLLLTSDIDIGASARDFLGVSKATALNDHEQNNFYNSATTFYRTVLESLVQNIPRNLSKVALMTITKVLKHPEDIHVSKSDTF